MSRVSVRAAAALVAVIVVVLLFASSRSAAAARRGRERAPKKTAAVVEARNVIAREALPEIEPVAAPQRPAAPKVVLSNEMKRLWTRDADRLVEAVEGAWNRNPTAVPLTFLLAIAHAETNGRILDVSEAGAVGLAQSTPIAYLSEGMTGKLFLTQDYVDGALAYILKKPLGDADHIASMVLEDPATLERAKTLLIAAYKLRDEGVDELMFLKAFAGEDYESQISALDRENLALLDELECLLGSNDPAALKPFRDRAHQNYRDMLSRQRMAWRRYQVELIDRRDALLRAKYREDPKKVMRERAYEAGEMLAVELDDRFSPFSMADFLNRHAETKLDQAMTLGVPQSEILPTAAALYNGGGHNVKRMVEGLMPSLRETENYMRKVPETQRTLDRALAVNEELRKRS